jgi:hypothetical protein
MAWVSAHDSDNCGLLEKPEAGDWSDLFARNDHDRHLDPESLGRPESGARRRAHRPEPVAM